jgi:hypothetical protein
VIGKEKGKGERKMETEKENGKQATISLIFMAIVGRSSGLGHIL